MDNKEYDEAMAIVQAGNEITLAAVLDKFKMTFKDAKATYLGRALGTRVRVEINVDPGEPRYEEMKQAGQEFEDLYSYPEFRIIVRQIDSEPK